MEHTQKARKNTIKALLRKEKTHTFSGYALFCLKFFNLYVSAKHVGIRIRRFS